MTLQNALGDLALDATVSDVNDSIVALGEIDFATESKLEQVRGLIALLGSEATLSVVSGKIGTPASDDLMTLLRAIEVNTAAEVTRTDTLNLTADQVQLNTDTVEALLADVSSRIGTTGVAGSAAAILDAIRLLLTGSLTVNLPAGASLDATLTNGSLRVGGTVDVSDRSSRVLGHVTIDSAPTTLPTGAATEATLSGVLKTGDLVGLDATTLAALETTSVANFPATQPVSGTVAVSNPTANPETGLAKDATLTTRLPAALDADGGVKAHVQNFPVTQPISAASLPLPIGSATETTLSTANSNLGSDGATPPAIIGTGIRGWLRGIYEKVAATLTTDVIDRSSRLLGHVTIDTVPTTTVTGPLTDTQLRATSVPVSNVSLPLPTGAATETTLSALNLKHAGDATNGSVIQQRVDGVTTGNITAAAQSVTAAVLPGMAGWSMYYAGTYSTGAILVMEASYDGGATYITARMVQMSNGALGYVLLIAAGINGSSIFIADIPAGATHVRVRCSTWPSPTGTINVSVGQAVQRFATPVVPQSVTVSAVSSVTPGTSATLLGKAEDAAHVTGDTGVAAWGVRNDALSTLTSTDGDYSPYATDGRGATLTNSATFTYAHIATSTTSVVKAGAGYLHSINVNTRGTVASIITVYDNTAGSGTVIAVIDSLNLSGTFVLDVAFSTGLTIVTTGTVPPDVTVSYR